MTDRLAELQKWAREADPDYIASEVLALEAQIDIALAQIERVRDVHAWDPADESCVGCQDTEFPCPTIAALEDPHA